MPKVLVVYDSRTGNTEEMAKAIADGAKRVGAGVDSKKVNEVKLDNLETADAIILGSPTHFGTMSENMKRLISESVAIRGKLEDKVGAAFTSSGAISGGNETTLLSMIQAMLIHGMLVIGDPVKAGGHYGVVCIGKPQVKELEACRDLGERVAKLTARFQQSELWH